MLNQSMRKHITEALETTSQARGSSLHYVNPAYTSQMDSKTGLLHGTRVGDKFHHANVEVGQADINAACNIKQRLSDKEITRYISYFKVQQILIDRFHASDELLLSTCYTSTTQSCSSYSAGNYAQYLWTSH